tara:strand:- start:27 stop:989 length:963 start_codon:yes stop_codon:yes gene_type:complete
MKKIFIILTFNLIFLNNSLSKIIELNCPTTHGTPILFDIDTEKKTVIKKYKYKFNLNKEIEFNFWVPSQKDQSKFTGFFVKINLENETYLMKVLDVVSKAQIRVMMRKIDNDQLYFEDIKEGIVQQELAPVKCQNLNTKGDIQNTSSNKKIEDYDLEQFKIGESLLEAADESFILDAIEKTSNYRGRKYYDVSFEMDSTLYDYANFYIKSGDLEYKILAIFLIKKMNLGQCLNKKKKLAKEWKKKFGDLYLISDKAPINTDNTGKSMTYVDQFIFPDNAVARITCNDWSKEVKKEYDHKDDLRASFESAEITKWMIDGYK